MKNSKSGLYFPNHHTLYILPYPAHSSTPSVHAPLSRKPTQKNTLPAKLPFPSSPALKQSPMIKKTSLNRCEEKKPRKEASRKPTAIFGRHCRSQGYGSRGKRRITLETNHKVKLMRWGVRYSFCRKRCRSRTNRSPNSNPRRNTIGSSK